MAESFLAKLRKAFAQNKVFFQRAMGYLSIINSGMILFLLLSRLQDYGISIYITKWFFPIFIAGIILMVIVGYIDHRLGFHKEELRIERRQDPYTAEIIERLERLEGKIDKQKKK